VATKQSNIDLHTYNALVNGIYDAAMDMSLWPQVLQQLAEAFNSQSGLLRIQDLQDHEVEGYFSYGLDPWFQQQYAEYYIHLDPVIPTVSQYKTGTALQTATLMPASFKKSEYYNDYQQPQGVEHVAGGFVARDHSRISLFGLQRAGHIGDYDQHEMDSLKLLIPHLQRAIDINCHLFRLTNQVNANRNIFDRLSVGVVLVAKSGTPLFINSSAEAMIADGCGLKASQAGLQLENHRDTQTLHKLIFDASRSTLKTGGVLNASTSSLLQPLTILVTPINKENDFDFSFDKSRVAAALFIDNKENQQHNFSLEIISKLYGLTFAEAKLAAALANGHSLDEIAHTFKLSKGTLRSQLKACFQKTGCSRQAELMKVLLSGLAVFSKEGDQ